MKLAGEPTSAWMWKAPPPGELVPDHPPVDLIELIESIEVDIKFPGGEEE